MNKYRIRIINQRDVLNEIETFYQRSLFDKVKFSSIDEPIFTFIDLFAGLGGFRLALQACGGRCLFSSEIDGDAQKTYLHNFGERPKGDITIDSTKDLIPEAFDVLCAGFPCQPFSVAGHRKGFEDTRGTLFFDIADITRKHQPKVLFLENVKNLAGHDNGNTLKVIVNTLKELGYYVYHKVLNAAAYANIPQNRERIFIVAFHKTKVPQFSSFRFPKAITLTREISDCIDYSIQDDRLVYTPEKMKHYSELEKNITSKATLYQWRRQYVRENKSKLCPTLTANMGTGGHNVPLILTDDGIRKLSPRECLNFQGYPSGYAFPESISMSAKYKQAGNSVVVPLITRIGEEIIKVILDHE